MSSCPEEPTPLNCGNASAEFLVSGSHIELFKEPLKPISVDAFGEVALKEVLIYRCSNSEGDSAEAYLQCAKCLSQVIRISDEPAGLSVELAGRLF